MKRSILLISLFLTGFVLSGSAANKPAYRIFTSKGKSTNYKAMVKESGSADVVFFGEMHDNPICHWMELQLTRDLLNYNGKQLVLGAEMFELDNQLLLNEYVTRQIIRKKDFDAEAKLWPNYKTDYSPILEFARENSLKFVATSIPRRFAAMVNLYDFDFLDTLMANERGLMAPRPIPYDSSLACYKNIGAAVQGMPHMGANLAKSQAMKDATMAWFIQKSIYHDSILFLHFNGAYHSDNHEGVVWMLTQYLRRGSWAQKILTISCIEQKDLDDLEPSNQGKADFIIVIPSDMTKTYATEPMFMSPAKPSADDKNAVKPKPKSKEKQESVDDDDDD